MGYVSKKYTKPAYRQMCDNFRFSKKFYVDVRKKYNYQKIVLYLWCNILILMRYDSKNLCGQFVPFEGIV